MQLKYFYWFFLSDVDCWSMQKYKISIIIRFLISRNKRNDYRLNWNSFKWKQPKRRLITEEREMPGSNILNVIGIWTETVNVLRLERVAGPPCTARPLSLTVGWLSEWGGRPTLMPAPMHIIIAFQFIFQLACSAMPVISTCILYQAFCGRTRKLWNFKVELVMMIASANIWDDYDCYDDNDDNWSTHHLKRMT